MHNQDFLLSLFQPTLTIENLRFDPSGNDVQIRARPSGLIASVLHALGVGAIYRFDMNAAGFTLETASFSGTIRKFCPKEHVSYCIFMQSKRMELLVLGAFLFMTSVPFLAGKVPVVGLLLMALSLALIGYFFFAKQRVTLGVMSDAGVAETIKLQADAEEQERLSQARKMMERIIGGTIDSRNDAWADDSEYAAMTKAGGGDGATVSCPHCQTRLKAPASLKGRTVACSTCQQTFQV